MNLLKQRVGDKRKIQMELAFVEVCVVIFKIFIQKFLNRNARQELGTEERRRDSRKRSSVLWLEVNLEIEHTSNCIKHFDNWTALRKNQKDNLDSFLMV